MRFFPLMIFLWFFNPLARAQHKTHLEVRFTQCEPKKDFLYLYSFNGFSFEQEQRLPISGDTLELEMDLPEVRFYYVGTGANNLKPVILGFDEEVVMEGNCARMRYARFPEGGVNADYEKLKADLNRLRAAHSRLVQEYNQVQRDSAAVQDVVERMAMIDRQKLNLLERMEKENPYFAEIVRLNTYLSFPAHGSNYGSEVPYFSEEYFKFVDWGKSDLDYMPWVFEAWKSYGETMCNLGLNANSHKVYIQKQLDKIPAGTRRRQLAYGGLLSALQRKKHVNYMFFAKQFVEEFSAISPKAVAQVQQQIKMLAATMPGALAPDFTGVGPDGDTVRLSDFRGKVVLIDFWASWCGPCRRENPNVVRAYQKYKDKGFDIIGVSLDRDRNRWISAIEADGLVWHHVSDLKGWKSEFAALYGVRSIPHAVLLDREGRIVAIRLRGAQLEEYLEGLLE